MDIKRVLIEDVSGSVIVPGQVIITGATVSPSILIPQHSHLRLKNVAGGLHLTMVSNIEPLDNGFCRVECPGQTIYLDELSTRDIGRKVGYSITDTRQGARSGFKKADRHRRYATLYCLNIGPKLFEPQAFLQVEISWAYVPAGLQLFITGSDPTGNAPLCEVFWIKLLLSWETLNLMGWGGSGPRGCDPAVLQGISQTDSPLRQRDPKKLHDLMIEQGLSSAAVPGSFSLTPSDRHPRSNRSQTKDSRSFVLLPLNPRDNEIHVTQLLYVEVLNSGFVRTDREYGWMVLDRFGWDWLEKGFKTKSSVSVTASGDMLGSVSHRTGGDEPWTADYTTQTINQIELVAELNAGGLALTAKGQLADVDPDKLRAIQQDGFTAKSAFHLSILMPWALLVLRQVSFAERISEF